MIDASYQVCDGLPHADSNPAIPKTLYRFSPALIRKGFAGFHPGSIARFETQAKSFMDKPQHRNGPTEYWAWSGMKSRCLNPKDQQWPRYGGRGIGVCKEWVDSFDSFYDYIGPKPSPMHSLDRINNNGNYEPGNVRWATRVVQQNNTRWNRLLTFNGKTQSLAMWSRELKISVEAVRARLNRGWSTYRALTRPLR